MLGMLAAVRCSMQRHLLREVGSLVFKRTQAVALYSRSTT
jgi:hypothetical protein